MTIVAFYSSVHPIEPWQEAARSVSGVRLVPLDEAADLDEPCYAIVLYPPRGALARIPDLRGILSIAAGVDYLRADPTTPDVPIYRQTDQSLQQTMVEYALMASLMIHRDMPRYLQQQRHRDSTMLLPLKLASQRRVGVLGLGNLGKAIAEAHARIGFTVHGWSRTPARIADVCCHAGPEGLQEMLGQLDILLNVLPLTEATAGIIDGTLLAALPRGASIINIGRGGHLVEADLLRALDDDQIAAAILDVTAEEPLPSDSLLWNHEKVVLTPHIAGDILIETVIATTFDHLAMLLKGQQPPGRYNPEVGY